MPVDQLADWLKLLKLIHTVHNKNYKNYYFIIDSRLNLSLRGFGVLGFWGFGFFIDVC